MRHRRHTVILSERSEVFEAVQLNCYEQWSVGALEYWA
jgi:hypothetical protein